MVLALTLITNLLFATAALARPPTILEERTVQPRDTSRSTNPLQVLDAGPEAESHGVTNAPIYSSNWAGAVLVSPSVCLGFLASLSRCGVQHCSCWGYPCFACRIRSSLSPLHSFYPSLRSRLGVPTASHTPPLLGWELTVPPVKPRFCRPVWIFSSMVTRSHIEVSISEYS